MNKILVVCGTFDRDGGRPSGLMDGVVKRMKENPNLDVTVYNGGLFADLRDVIYPQVADYPVVMWFANVPNDEIKVRDVKALNPKTILVTSKRNDNDTYTFAELISRALAIKANLTVEFSKQASSVFKMMLFDPLGNVFYEGVDIEKMTDAMVHRVLQLQSFTRVPTVQNASFEAPAVPNESRFFEFAHKCADIFHNLIQPAKGTERFLGNMSFRCQNGFPSFRGEDGFVYVSRRNVNKADISADSFVPTYLDDACAEKDGFGRVFYFGDNKPSVDTPVQLRLYRLFPWANYMLHAHCFVDVPLADGFYTYETSTPVPCGALEEVDEICNTIGDIERINESEPRLLAINLAGHGCILIAKDVNVFEELRKYRAFCFYQRKMPNYV